MGGWVGGWVGYLGVGVRAFVAVGAATEVQVEAVAPAWERWVGGWMGGWVGWVEEKEGV